MKLRTIEKWFAEDDNKLRIELSYGLNPTKGMMWFAAITEFEVNSVPLYKTEATTLEQCLRQLELRVTRACAEGA